MAERVRSLGFAPLTLSRHRHGLLIRALDGAAPAPMRRGPFAVYTYPSADDIIIVHDFPDSRIDNAIAGVVADQLLPLLADTGAGGWCNGDGLSPQQLFEGCVGAIVRSTSANERRAWHRFYDNTLAALDDGAAGRPRDGGVIADFGAIYRTAASLIADVDARTVLDAATCFGFLPLWLATGGAASPGLSIVGCDINPALVALASDYRDHRMLAAVAFVCADILAADLPDRVGASFDVVTAIHVLEHLTADQTVVAIANLLAVARRRLIVAVPYEAVPDARFGHRQAFDPGRLAALGAGIDARCHSFEDHGGWLVIDPVAPAPGQPEMQP